MNDDRRVTLIGGPHDGLLMIPPKDHDGTLMMRTPRIELPHDWTLHGHRGFHRVARYDEGPPGKDGRRQFYHKQTSREVFPA